MIDLGITDAHLYNAWRVEARFTMPGGASWPSEGPDQGTGFLIGHEDRTHVALVTNRHVLDPSFLDRDKVGFRLHMLTLSGYAFTSGGETTPQVLELISDEIPVEMLSTREDVALVGLGGFEVTSGPPSIDRWYSRSLLAESQEFGAEVFAGDFVVIPGYPKLEQEQVTRPVLLPGIVSSDPRYPFSPGSGPRTFLVHAFSREGLSGAPVWATQRGIALSGPLVGPPHRVARLIGINAGHFGRDSDGPAAFSFAVRSDAILDLIGHWEIRS